jgi:hypothetical protein
MTLLRRFPLALLFLTLAWGCEENAGPAPAKGDSVDRAALLQFWAADIIEPRYQAYDQAVNQLEQSAQAFVEQPGITKYQKLYDRYRTAYLRWQAVAPLPTPAAEALGLANYTNVYPVDTAQIETHIREANIDLSLPSTFDEQGFPALDYLLAGPGSPQTILRRFQDNPARGQYLLRLTGRLANLSQQVMEQWDQGGRSNFIAADGASATASVNQLVNDYIYYYERKLRAGKIGIPAGVFSGSPRATAVEAPFSDTLSRSLALASIEACARFFRGESERASRKGPSLKSYLDTLGTRHQDGLLSEAIVGQFARARQKVKALPPSFATAVRSQNTLMLEAYDALQVNVVYLKVDMLQALNIRVDYVDADGD